MTSSSSDWITRHARRGIAGARLWQPAGAPSWANASAPSWAVTGARVAAAWLRPDLTSPSAPLATMAWLDSFTPSLMPRTSLLQGVVAGLSLLSARGIANRAEVALNPALGPRGNVLRRLAVRGVVAVVGTAATSMPDRDDEPLGQAALRDGGHLLRAVAAGGAIHDVGHEAWTRQASWVRLGDTDAVRPIVASASVLAGVGLWASRRLTQRTAAVEPWPIDQRTTLPEAAAISGVVVVGGRLVGAAIAGTTAGLRAWLGPGPVKGTTATLISSAAWAGLAGWTYARGVEAVGAPNQRLEPGYEQAPTNPRVSGGPGSIAPFGELGRQGRRFVTDVVSGDQIESVMGVPALADPVRVYVGVQSEPLYPTARAEMALEELERLGAYDMRHLLLVSPTGTGWIDQTLVESAELLMRGDVATVAIQYGRSPSFLAAHKVALGRMQFRILLLGVRERLRAVPPERRPKVLVFGESMGAWTASDVIMHQGLGGFDHYGIDRALWVALPYLAKWSRDGMAKGRSALVPPGTVGVFDRHEQMAALAPEQRERLRAVILSHDNDPVALLGPELAVKRPTWLAEAGPRGRGVPAEMRWTPVVTFLQTAVDALNSMVQVPGKFGSFGHDYRADMARFVHSAYHLPSVTPAQMRAVEAALVRYDLDRAGRLGQLHATA